MAKTSKIKRFTATAILFGIGTIIAVAVMMFLSIVTDYGVTIASFGATIFMIISKNKFSRKKIFGAYLIASVIGCTASLLPMMTSFTIALASITSFAAMTMLDLQHAPAVGFAVSMVLNKFSFWTDFFVALSIFIILGMAIFFKAYLKDPDTVLNFVHIETEKINWDF